MKHIATLFLLLSCGFAHAQALYDNFENVRENSYGFNIPFPEQQGNGIGGTTWPGWSGVLIQYAVNPFPDGTNDSPLVMEYTRNPSEAFDVIIVPTGPLADLSDYVSGVKEFQMTVWSPIPGTVWQVTLESEQYAQDAPYPNGRHSEYQATSTLGSQWETLTFTLTGEPWQEAANNSWWPNAAAAHNGADRYVILINPGVQGSDTYYLDNIEGPERVEGECTEDANPWIINDGDCQQNSFIPNYMDGRLSLVQDPDDSQDDHCLEYARNGGATDDVIVGNFGGALDFQENPMMSISVYDLAAPSTVFISLQDEFGTELGSLSANTTASNQWETFTADLSALSNFPNVTNFVILVDAGNPVAKTVYFDDWRFENETSVGEVAELEGRVFPNPVQDVLTLETPGGTGNWQLMDATGRVVRTFQGNVAQRTEIDVQDLVPGTYTLHIALDGRVMNSAVIKH